ncbi:DUF2934 domain-containing protein [Bosea sp. 124]|uniref:DUF2934 domain-containing protein n=1 Tax=Bosea sp. 124 TaxID=2135642 RepID=UPI000D39F890|nr:DUF2934 domain-containing protein [Bosea sp. 124]PTM39638.1 hypothetical protein C8D03_1143 [Bosea sp. 124]
MKDDRVHSEIRKIAYQLWVQDGCPDGQDRRHWDVAKEIWAFRHSGEDAPQASSHAAPTPRAPGSSERRAGPTSRRGVAA